MVNHDFGNMRLGDKLNKYSGLKKKEEHLKCNFEGVLLKLINFETSIQFCFICLGHLESVPGAAFQM